MPDSFRKILLSGLFPAITGFVPEVFPESFFWRLLRIGDMIGGSTSLLFVAITLTLVVSFSGSFRDRKSVQQLTKLLLLFTTN